MIFNIIKKTEDFFELMKPYKKIQENLKKKFFGGEISPAEGNNNENEEIIGSSFYEKNENFSQNEAEQNKKEKTKISKNEEAKKSKMANENMEDSASSNNILDNFMENIQKIDLIKNEIFGPKKSSPNFSYRMPDEAENKISKINTINENNNVNINSIINTNKNYKMQSGGNFTFYSSPNEKQENNFEEFGKMLAQALKNAAQNKSVAQKY